MSEKEIKTKNCISEMFSPDVLVSMYQTLAQAVAEHVFVLDESINVVYATPKTIEQCGLTGSDINGKPVAILLEALHFPSDMRKLRKNLASGVFRKKFYSNVLNDSGRRDWYEYHVTPVYTNDGRRFFQTIITNITALQDIDYFKNHDQLTGLYNRDQFFNNIHKKNRQSHFPLGVAIVLLDNLRLVNESLGFSAGSEMLRCTAQIIDSSMPIKASAYRLESDQFAIILSNTTADDARGLLSMISQKAMETSTNGVMSLYSGFAIKEKTEDNIAALVLKAEHQAKKQAAKTRLNQTRQAVDSILAKISTKDVDQVNYATDLAALCYKLARVMHQKEASAICIATAAYLHNIGYITEKLRNKKITDEEALHASCNIARSISQCAEAASLLLAHHEEWNGNGFPFGLKGKAIPLGARIFAICKDYTDMMIRRKTNAPNARNKGLNAIEAEAGKKYDPAVANVFIDAVRTGKFDLIPLDKRIARID